MKRYVTGKLLFKELIIRESRMRQQKLDRHNVDDTKKFSRFSI